MRLILAVILGGLVAFVWGFIVWATPHPFKHQFLRQAPDELTLMSTVTDSAPDPGVYLFPYPPADMADEAAVDLYSQRHERGPVGVLVVNQGTKVMMPIELAVGYLIYAGSALLMALLFLQMPHAGIATRITAGVILGLFLSAKVHLINWHFMFQPADATIARIIETMIGTVGQALVIGLVLRPKKPASED